MFNKINKIYIISIGIIMIIGICILLYMNITTKKIQENTSSTINNINIEQKTPLRDNTYKNIIQEENKKELDKIIKKLNKNLILTNYELILLGDHNVNLVKNYIKKHKMEIRKVDLGNIEELKDRQGHVSYKLNIGIKLHNFYYESMGFNKIFIDYGNTNINIDKIKDISTNYTIIRENKVGDVFINLELYGKKTKLDKIKHLYKNLNLDIFYFLSGKKYHILL